MVNLGKRMRNFQPLLDLRRGQGASILPPAPAPQLTALHIRYPRGPWGSDVAGAHGFTKRVLPKIKYHNPNLPITFENVPGDRRSPMTLTLHFEGSDAEKLRQIAQKTSLPPLSERRRQRQLQQEASEEQKEADARKQSPNWRDAHRSETSEPSTMSTRPSANDDEVVLKPQATTTTSATPIYTRSVTLGLRGRSTTAIWDWFVHRTKAEAVPTTPEDELLAQRLEELAANAEIDRRRVKAGVEAVKKEKEDLKRAREAADRLTAEAA